MITKESKAKNEIIDALINDLSRLLGCLKSQHESGMFFIEGKCRRSSKDGFVSRYSGTELSFGLHKPNELKSYIKVSGFCGVHKLVNVYQKSNETNEELISRAIDILRSKRDG